MEYRKGILKTKTKAFVVRVVKLYRYLSQTKNEHVMSKQLLRSGTAIGALQREGEYAESKLDFVHKYAIAQKECNESLYWLELLHETSYLNTEEYSSMFTDAEEIMKLLTASICTAKTNHLSLTR
ncbi:four helix bundle protein [Bacteroides sp.]|uniref:four helix bundle protein n=1 Tax=Bacteroides sp. TaxID=29523 RepID=UPI0025BBA370|nr:four helix bundle protein [Bacteroides sp.]